MIPFVTLTIAGSDSGGGAGIQADIKAFQANGTFATSVITAITAQNSQAVTRAMDLPVDIIAAQLEAVLGDFPVAAAKTGMLSSPDIIRTVTAGLRKHGLKTLVVDPVMISKSGFDLLHPDAISVLRDELLPLATICTPNAHEAARLTGMGPICCIKDAKRAATIIHEMGADAVLIKGGHLRDEPDAVDVLFDGTSYHYYHEERVDTPHTHGTGCTYAAAIAANLAKGYALDVAVARAKLYVTKAIRGGLPLGSGHGPTDHFYFLRGGHDFPFD